MKEIEITGSGCFLGFTMLGCSLIFAGLAIYRTEELRNEQRNFEQPSKEVSDYECAAAEAADTNSSLCTGVKEPSVPEDKVEILPQYIELAQQNPKMFGSVLEYQNKEYWEEHPVICFDTLYEKQEYEVMAAFFDKVYRSDAACFKYYDY